MSIVPWCSLAACTPTLGGIGDRGGIDDREVLRRPTHPEPSASSGLRGQDHRRCWAADVGRRTTPHQFARDRVHPRIGRDRRRRLLTPQETTRWVSGHHLGRCGRRGRRRCRRDRNTLALPMSRRRPVVSASAPGPRALRKHPAATTTRKPKARPLDRAPSMERPAADIAKGPRRVASVDIGARSSMLPVRFVRTGRRVAAHLTRCAFALTHTSTSRAPAPKNVHICPSPSSNAGSVDPRRPL